MTSARDFLKSSCGSLGKSSRNEFQRYLIPKATRIIINAKNDMPLNLRLATSLKVKEGIPAYAGYAKLESMQSHAKYFIVLFIGELLHRVIIWV